MPKLNQIIAIEPDAKRLAADAVSHAVGVFIKPGLMSGLIKTYQPKDEEGEKLPSEAERVQYRVWDEIDAVRLALARLFDVTAAKDWANAEAKADVVVDGEILLEGVPTPFLLFLEKQLGEMEQFAKRLPVYDSSKEWVWDDGLGLHKTMPIETARSKKVPRVLVKYDATDRHPAQTEVWQEDVIAGTWTKVEFTSALARTRVIEILDRIRKLHRAVKSAREEANGLELDGTRKGPGQIVLDYIFKS